MGGIGILKIKAYSFKTQKIFMKFNQQSLFEVGMCWDLVGRGLRCKEEWNLKEYLHDIWLLALALADICKYK